MDLDIDVWLSSPLVDLVTEGDKVTGAIVKHEDKSIEIHVRQGVVLACGGFPHDILRRKQLFPHAPTGKEHFTPSPTANTGDGLKVAEKVGGWVDTTIPNARLLGVLLPLYRARTELSELCLILLIVPSQE
jgi:succinate dehydrogenase/fumarate reductase flavoprotein subunit